MMQTEPRLFNPSGSPGDVRTSQTAAFTNHDQNKRLARGLGWFSVGLGLAQLVAPGAVCRLAGVRDDRERRLIMMSMGVRELACGVGILQGDRSAGWLFARVVGDAVDLAALGRAYGSRDNDRSKVGRALAAVAGVTALDVLTAQKLRKAQAEPAADSERGKRVKATITIECSPGEAYAVWRDFERLPRFMAHLESVQELDSVRSHWVARGPAGKSVHWDAEITDDQPGRRIAWSSVGRALVANSGSVEFRPAAFGRGTEVHVSLHYDPPGGRIGATVAGMFGEEPGQQARGDLRRLKQLIELGEVVHSDASIHPRMHAARPVARAEIQSTRAEPAPLLHHSEVRS